MGDTEMRADSTARINAQDETGNNKNTDSHEITFSQLELNKHVMSSESPPNQMLQGMVVCF